ncbi:MAG: AI-2E family transporter [Legionellales bacterium]|nr:AI-2E family transporter [Legionellales bacterium]
MLKSRSWIIIGFFFVVIFLIYHLSAVLVPFLTAALIAYLFDPLVDFLQRLRISRTIGVVIVFIILFFIMILCVFSLLPLLQKQISLIINRFPQFLENIQQTLIPWLQEHLGLNLHLDLGQVKNAVTQHWQQAGNVAVSVMSAVTHSGLAVLAFFTNLILIPVVTFYLLRDWDRLIAGIQRLLPRPQEPIISALAKQCDEVIAAFLRGQLLVMLGLGIIYTLGLLMIGLDVAVIIGMLAGLMSIVPYLGFIVGMIAASLAAYLQFHDVIHLIYVLIVFAVGQTVESSVLTPILVGDKIGLHPVAVIFAILVGGQFFGFTGVLLALPVAAVTMVLIRYWRTRYLHSELYSGASVVQVEEK